MPEPEDIKPEDTTAPEPEEIEVVAHGDPDELAEGTCYTNNSAL